MVMISKEWKELYRSAIFLMIIILIFLSTRFVLYQFRGMETHVSFRTGLVPGFQSSIYFLPLLALIYGAFSILLEKDQRTLIMFAARGKKLSEFVLGKVIALYAVFLPTVLVAYTLALLPAKMVFGELILYDFSIFLLSILILSAIFLAIGVFLGAGIHQKLKLMGTAIGIWLALIYLFDLLLMYWLPSVTLNDVLFFSIIYFLSPINAVSYFLFVKLSVYQLSDLSVVYEHFTFQSPWLVFIGNAILWIGISIFASIYVLKRKGVSHD